MNYTISSSTGKMMFGEYLSGYEIIPLGKEDVFGLKFYGDIQLNDIYVNISSYDDISRNMDMVFRNELRSYSFSVGEKYHIELVNI
jgi:hypothetical protein